MKRFIILVSSTPDKPEFGYADHFELIGENNLPLMGGHCSTCPNPYRASDYEPWKNLYDWIAPGQYRGQCIQHHKYGKCLLLNEGDEVKSRNPIANPDGSTFTEVFVHVGGFRSVNPQWRGSKGCITIPTNIYAKFMSHFSVNESVQIDVIDFFENRKEASMPFEKLKARFREEREKKRKRLEHALAQIAKEPVTRLVVDQIAQKADGVLPKVYNKEKGKKKTVEGALDGVVASVAVLGSLIGSKYLLPDMDSPELENAIAGLIAALIGAVVTGIRRRVKNKRKIRAQSEE